MFGAILRLTYYRRFFLLHLDQKAHSKEHTHLNQSVLGYQIATHDPFVADFVFVKYDQRGNIENMVIGDAKLSEFTDFTDNQKEAIKQLGKGFVVKSRDILEDIYGTPLPKTLTQGTKINSILYGFYKIIYSFYYVALSTCIGTVNSNSIK